jgi:hypothetical protein
MKQSDISTCHDAVRGGSQRATTLVKKNQRDRVIIEH